MPKKTSSSDSDRGSHRRKKTSRRHSSSSSEESSDLGLNSKRRHRVARRSRSRSRDRSRRQSPKKRLRHSRSRSSSRGRRSRRSSRSRSSSKGKSRVSKHKKSHHRHKSRSRSPSKNTGIKVIQLSPEKDEGILKMKIQQVLKAAATANAELRDKGLLPSGTEIVQSATMSISDQMKRAQAIDEINAPSFSQQAFLSSRTTGKQISETVSEDMVTEAHAAAIFGLASPKLGISVSADASIKKLESWKENPEKLVHENLFTDQSGKEERWKKKLMALRRKNINGEAYM